MAKKMTTYLLEQNRKETLPVNVTEHAEVTTPKICHLSSTFNTLFTRTQINVGETQKLRWETNFDLSMPIFDETVQKLRWVTNNNKISVTNRETESKQPQKYQDP